MNIGLFGGAFDPIHNGHVSVAVSCLKSGFIDKLWLIPTYASPHKPDGHVASFPHRLEMAKLAFKEEPLVEIKEFEKRLPAPNYTLRTLDFLQNKYPKFTFLWCIGSDNLLQLKNWHNFENILKRWKLLVIARPGFAVDDIDTEILDRCHFVNHVPVNISSSDIRNNVPRVTWSSYIPENVINYAKKHHLYGL
jgi:nicotinate-nucleotide adenylyltransferase